MKTKADDGRNKVSEFKFEKRADFLTEKLGSEMSSSIVELVCAWAENDECLRFRDDVSE